MRNSGAASIQEKPQLLGSWNTKAPMPTARTALAAGVVEGGLHPKIYAVGGFDCASVLNTIEAFNRLH
jgi:hypothetical protein